MGETNTRVFRVMIDFTPEAYKKLQDLQQRTEMTATQFFEAAFLWTQATVEMLSKGKKILEFDPETNEASILTKVIPGFD